MFKIAVVEDNSAYVNKLVALIKDYEKRTKTSIDIDVFADGDEILENYNPIYNIIFMDIQMKRLNGISTAEVIRKRDEKVIIIFLTHIAQYAVMGYKVNAYRYLLKPITTDALFATLDGSIEKIISDQDYYLPIRTRDGRMRVNIDKILYIESFDKEIHICCDDKTIISTEKLYDLYDKHKKAGLYRCGKSFIVNYKKIDSIQGNIVKTGGYEIKISRGKKKELMELMMKHFRRII